MRIALLVALLSLLAPASAQDLRIADPVLSIDGRRATTIGAPLIQRSFGVLTLGAPGLGTFTVSDRPFAGARAAGQFDGDGLYFSGGGRTVRLRSSGPILGDGQRLAYVRFQPSSRAQRGPVRLSVAEGPDGRGVRNSAPRPAVAERAQRQSGAVRRGPAPARPARVSLETTRLRAETARLRADLDRLLDERRRLAEQRTRLAAERDAARQAQAATDARLQRTLAARADTDRRAQADRSARELRLSREAQNAADLARSLTAQRDALAAERDRLLSERSELIATRNAAEANREREASAFRELQERLATVESRPGPRPSSDELRTLRAQTTMLRARLVERDQTIEALRAERDDRTGQAASVGASLADVQAELDDLRQQLQTTRAERDAALADARSARAELQARADDASVPADLAELRTRLAAETTALEAAREALDREQRLLRAERAALSAIPRGDDADARLALAEERQEMLALLEVREADVARREALVAEQEALQDDRERLARELSVARAEIAELRTELTARGVTPPAEATTSTPSASSETPPDGAVAYLPGFDFARLANPDNVRRRLDEIRYPRWAESGRIEGDVLVLFQTDSDGAVIRTAVPSPLGGGLDALAEDLVRQMRFTPPTVSGQPTGLRSQVTVRFAL